MESFKSKERLTNLTLMKDDKTHIPSWKSKSGSRKKKLQNNEQLSSQLFVLSRIKYKIEVTEGTAAGILGLEDHRFCVSKHKQLKYYSRGRRRNQSYTVYSKSSTHKEKALFLDQKRLTTVKKQLPLACSFDAIASCQSASNLRVNPL